MDHRAVPQQYITTRRFSLRRARGRRWESAVPLSQVGQPRRLRQTVAAAAGQHQGHGGGQRYPMAGADVHRPHARLVRSTAPMTSPSSVSRSTILPRRRRSRLTAQARLGAADAGPVEHRAPRWQASPKRRGWARPWASKSTRSGTIERELQACQDGRRLAKGQQPWHVGEGDGQLGQRGLEDGQVGEREDHDGGPGRLAAHADVHAGHGPQRADAVLPLYPRAQLLLDPPRLRRGHVPVMQKCLRRSSSVLLATPRLRVRSASSRSLCGSCLWLER